MSRKRSRSSSIVRSTSGDKLEVLDSFCETMKLTLTYLANASNSLIAIKSIREYATERLKEVSLFGSSDAYNADLFKPINDLVDVYLENKNKASYPNEDTNHCFEIVPTKLNTLAIISGYIDCLKTVIGFSNPLSTIHLEKYVRNKMVDVLAFHGSAVILRDDQTSNLINSFNAALQQSSGEV